MIAQKLIAFTSRKGQPKAGTDWRDLTILLLQFPNLKMESGEVLDRLKALQASSIAIEEWRKLVATEIRPEDTDEGY
jgi:hypothetical protein